MAVRRPLSVDATLCSQTGAGQDATDRIRRPEAVGRMRARPGLPKPRGPAGRGMAAPLWQGTAASTCIRNAQAVRLSALSTSWATANLAVRSMAAKRWSQSSGKQSPGLFSDPPHTRRSAPRRCHVDEAGRVALEPLALRLAPSTSGSREMSWRCRHRCSADRIRWGIEGCRAWGQWSNGSSVCCREATTIASSVSVGTDERGSFGPVCRSSTVARFRHFAAVLRLIPSSLLGAASDACDLRSICSERAAACSLAAIATVDRATP